MTFRIAVLGQMRVDAPARASIVPALQHASKKLSLDIDVQYLGNSEAEQLKLRSYDGFFIAPGAPSEDCQAILDCIRWALKHAVPCIGTCGGFQRMVAAFATERLGFDRIVHQETEPNAPDPFFAALKCSLVRQTANIRLMPETQAMASYARANITESFFCSYGINPKFTELLEARGLAVSGSDGEGDVRIVELPGHPFFIGTLFVPQVQSTASDPHPLIVAFLKTVKDQAI